MNAFMTILMDNLMDALVTATLNLTLEERDVFNATRAVASLTLDNEDVIMDDVDEEGDVMMGE